MREIFVLHGKKEKNREGKEKVEMQKEEANSDLLLTIFVIDLFFTFYY